MGRPRSNPRYCTESGCLNITRARGLCANHYEQLRRRRTPDAVCPVAECSKTVTPGCAGLCSMHYMRRYRHGDTDTVLPPYAVAERALKARRVVQATPWMADAACRDMPTATFFPTQDNNDPTRSGPWHVYRSYQIAKAICAPCPVRADCLAYALDDDIPFGIYGGLSPRERRRLKKDLA